MNDLKSMSERDGEIRRGEDLSTETEKNLAFFLDGFGDNTEPEEPKTHAEQMKLFDDEEKPVEEVPAPTPEPEPVKPEPAPEKVEPPMVKRPVVDEPVVKEVVKEPEPEPVSEPEPEIETAPDVMDEKELEAMMSKLHNIEEPKKPEVTSPVFDDEDLRTAEHDFFGSVQKQEEAKRWEKHDEPISWRQGSYAVEAESKDAQGSTWKEYKPEPTWNQDKWANENEKQVYLSYEKTLREASVNIEGEVELRCKVDKGLEKRPVEYKIKEYAGSVLKAAGKEVITFHCVFWNDEMDFEVENGGCDTVCVVVDIFGGTYRLYSGSVLTIGSLRITVDIEGITIEKG